jgi:DNA-binding response OmpR family regulator
MAAETVLIIEDDPTMLRVLRDNFEYSGFAVLTADDGEQGLQMALGRTVELIVLDIMLPGINGYEICRRVRQQGIDAPIIMLTAKGQESDIVLGLNLGADDYVTKPFGIKELLARAEAFLRRRRRQEPEVYRFGQCELHMASRRVVRDGAEVPLTPKEFDLLALFARHPGRALTRDEILRSVWGDDLLVTTRSVDRFINTLRKKIEPDPRRATIITTIRNIGYRFEGG